MLSACGGGSDLDKAEARAEAAIARQSVAAAQHRVYFDLLHVWKGEGIRTPAQLQRHVLFYVAQLDKYSTALDKKQTARSLRVMRQAVAPWCDTCVSAIDNALDEDRDEKVALG